MGQTCTIPTTSRACNIKERTDCAASGSTLTQSVREIEPERAFRDVGFLSTYKQFEDIPLSEFS